MTNYNLLKSTVAGAFIAATCGLNAWAQTPPTPTITSGRYTVNSYGHTNGRNFRTFADLATALSGATLTGDVTIDVVLYHSVANDRVNQKFTYTESQPFVLTKWTSGGHHVTLDGHGEGIRVLSTTATAAIELAGVCDFTLKNLVVDETSSSTTEYRMRGIWIRPTSAGVAANNVTISNCIIRNNLKEGCETCAYGGINPTSYLPSAAGIVVSSQASTLSAHNGPVATNCVLEYNEINGGYWGIAMAGTSASTGNKIVGNFLSNIRGIGIKIQEVPGLIIQGNTMRSIFKLDDVTEDNSIAYTSNRAYKRPYQGISIKGNPEEGGMPGLLIDGNDLMDFRGPFGYGISVVDVAQARISNNIVAGFKQVKVYNPNTAPVSGSMLALVCQSSSNLDIIQNTLVMDAMTTPVDTSAYSNPGRTAVGGVQVRALYIRGGTEGTNDSCEYVTGIRILNNVLAYAGDGLAAYTDPATYSQIDYGIATFSEIGDRTSGLWPNFNNNFFYHISNGNPREITAYDCRNSGSVLTPYASLSAFTSSSTSIGYLTNGNSYESNASLVAVFNKNFTLPVNTEKGDYHLKENPSISSTSPDQIRSLVGASVTTALAPTDLYDYDIDGNLRPEFTHVVVGADQVPVTTPQHRPAGPTSTPSNFTPAPRALQVMLAPNPLDQRTLQVSVQALQAGAATLTVVDGLGRLVKTQAVTLTAGEQAVKVDLGTLPKGSYFVRLTQGRNQTTQQLLKH